MVTFICGFPRTGTSLCMQMLAAPGLNCPGKYPGYESDRWDSLEGIDPSLALEYDAIKWLEPHVTKVSYAPCRIIATRRGIDEQVKSHIKFLRETQGIVLTRPQKKVVRRTLTKERKAFWAKVNAMASSVLVLQFETVLSDPLGTAEMVAEFVGQGDPEVMAGVVVPRGPKCLPNMLEVELRRRGSTLDKPPPKV